MEIDSTATALEGTPAFKRLCRQLHQCVREAHPDLPTVHLILTDDAYIRRLNADYRAKDRPTDVLSFDLRSAGPTDPAQLAQAGGEIYISVQRAQDQAAALGVSLDAELARLLVHGLLHLAGLDHDTPKTLRHMEKETDRILASTGVLPSPTSN